MVGTLPVTMPSVALPMSTGLLVMAASMNLAPEAFAEGCTAFAMSFISKLPGAALLSDTAEAGATGTDIPVAPDCGSGTVTVLSCRSGESTTRAWSPLMERR